MNPTPEQITKLHKLATLKGVQVAYQSAFGTTIEAAPQGLLVALNALGGEQLEGDLSNLDRALAAEEKASWSQLSEPVVVFWEGKKTALPLRFAEAEASSARKSGKGKPAARKKIKVEVKFKLENGKTFSLKADPAKLKTARTATIDGISYREASLPVTRKLPPGYHQATIIEGRRKQQVLIIAAPWKAFKPSRGPARSLGIFAPTYALHSKESMGIGDFTELSRLIDWAYGLGCDFVGTLPMLSIFNDKPLVEPSPYSPLSRVHWNEMYVDPRAADEWAECAEARKLADSPEFKAKSEALRAEREVKYQEAAQLKRPVLEAMARLFFRKKKHEKPAFRKFLKLYPTVENYAEFRAANEKSNKVWREWAESKQHGKVARSDYEESDKRYHLYVQYLAHQQLSRISERSAKKGRGIYLDFPLSAHADGYDVWAERESFAEVVSAGCPPDPAHVHGQDWGILPMNPRSIRLNGYRYFRRCLESHMRYAGLLRLDHVMCFYRLYWVPRGLGAKNGVYIRYNMDEFFALLVLESHRNGCTLIGEDLGTVPPEIREAMTQHGILRMYVQQRRLTPDLKEPLPPVPPDCICSLNTHDMPPFAAFWAGHDIEDKLKLGYFGEKELPAKLAAREDQKKALLSLLVGKGLLKGPTTDVAEVFLAMLRLTAADPVKVMQVNIEDLWQEVLPQNVPGTWKERPNWRRKCRYAIEELPGLPGTRELFGELARLRKRGR